MERDGILIVDGDEPRCGELVALLRMARYPTEQVSGAEAALYYLRSRPDCGLVLTDIDLPDSDGLTLLEQISRAHPEPGVIVATWEPDVELVAAAFRHGATDVLLLPLEPRYMLAAVHRAVEHAKMRRQMLDYRKNLEDLIAQRSAKLQEAMTDLERSYDITLEAMGDALDLRDEETEGHSKRVTAYTIALARAMHLRSDELKTIARGAFLHDIGKIAIPDAILLKPGKLTLEEMQIMRTHCERGYNTVRKIPFLEEAAEIVFSHQECWDGSGYPRGLCGEEIPLGARIFAIADTLDAITSDRPYRRGRSFAEAIQEIAKCAGSQFDPAIVEVFLRLPRETWPTIKSAVGRHSHAAELVRAAAA